MPRETVPAKPQRYQHRLTVTLVGEDRVQATCSGDNGVYSLGRDPRGGGAHAPRDGAPAAALSLFEPSSQHQHARLLRHRGRRHRHRPAGIHMTTCLTVTIAKDTRHRRARLHGRQRSSADRSTGRAGRKVSRASTDQYWP